MSEDRYLKSYQCPICLEAQTREEYYTHSKQECDEEGMTQDHNSEKTTIAREFWIIPDEEAFEPEDHYVGQAFNSSAKCIIGNSPAIHVIEKTAFDELTRNNSAMEKNILFLNGQVEELNQRIGREDLLREIVTNQDKTITELKAALHKAITCELRKPCDKCREEGHELLEKLER